MVTLEFYRSVTLTLRFSCEGLEEVSVQNFYQNMRFFRLGIFCGLRFLGSIKRISLFSIYGLIKDLLYDLKHQKMIFDLAGPSEKSRAGSIAPSCPLG